MAGDDTWPACGFDAGTTYKAENGLFRIWCALCSHSTRQYADLDLEWLGNREAVQQ